MSFGVEVDDLSSLVVRARGGDADAYEVLVRRFQDMAFGYGYSILKDFQLAEDAAQEAFLEAYRNLPKLREPAAFPGWFRRIVFKQCDRMIRGASILMVPLDGAEARASQDPGPAEEVERGELKGQILGAIDSLPEHERSTAMLYYISAYSQREIAEFLGIPVTTVKKRLHSARARLRESLMEFAEDLLRQGRPSRDEQFATRVMELLKAARAGDIARVKELLEQDPRLLTARDPFGNTALILAVNSGHRELAELLLDSGIELDIYQAAAIGETEKVEEWLRKDPNLLNSFSPEGATPLHLAAHFGHSETLEFLLLRGADKNVISRHEIQVTPLHAALYGRRTEIAKILLSHGADVTIKRGGKNWPRAGWTALHYAAGCGFVDLVEPMLDLGADIHARDDEGRTPFRVALEESQDAVAEILRRRGAQQ